MIIFSHTLTPRLQYVVHFLSEYFATPFRIICDEEKYQQEKDPFKINYSYHRIGPGEVWIHSHVLLFETAVRQVKVECYDQPSSSSGPSFKAFFKTEGDYHFDLFAGIFYLLSRYEEYLPHTKDSYGRYAHENALAYKEDFLHLPLINIWLKDFSFFLNQRFEGLQLKGPDFSFLPTYDIDMAWSYKYKGFKRNAGAIIKLLFTGKWGTLAHRIRVLKNKFADPYDVYDWLHHLHEQYDLKPIYFFLVARQTGRYDKNIDIDHPEFRSLVHHIAQQYRIGLHPSWASGDHPSLLTAEKEWLRETSLQSITASRQHYIRFELPLTYRRLIALGMTEDYSMGYGSINGFRASVATPFFWFDLKNEAVTPLRVFPFCFMEATSYHEQQMDAADALKELMQYYQTVRDHNGMLITIWHNSFLGTDPAVAGWKEAYEQFISQASTGA